MTLDLDAIDRYGRQIVLAEWGPAGQERLATATVAVRGGGVAAERAALYLAGAGVARLVVDGAAIADAARALNPRIAVMARAAAAAGSEGEGEGERGAGTAARTSDVGAAAAAVAGAAVCVTVEVTVEDDGAPGDGARTGTRVRVQVSGGPDHAAIGAAVAIEALKALVGLPHRDVVTLPGDLTWA